MASAPLPETLSIKIPAVQVSEYVTFQIFVTRADLVWSVRRRYQEFVKLNDAMKRVLPPGQLPELPAKTFRMGMSKFEPNFIEARRQKLEEYLADLIAAVPPERIDALDDFLAYSEHCLLEMVEHLGACVASVESYLRPSSLLSRPSDAQPPSRRSPTFTACCAKLSKHLGVAVAVAKPGRAELGRLRTRMTTMTRLPLPLVRLQQLRHQSSPLLATPSCSPRCR